MIERDDVSVPRPLLPIQDDGGLAAAEAFIDVMYLRGRLSWTEAARLQVAERLVALYVARSVR